MICGTIPKIFYLKLKAFMRFGDKDFKINLLICSTMPEDQSPIHMTSLFQKIKQQS